MSSRVSAPLPRALRWAGFVLWTGVIIYSMDIMKPTESTCIVGIKTWAATHGIEESLPSDLYHICSFLVWGILLTSVAAHGELANLSRRRIVLCAVITLAFAAVAELLQALNPGRTPCCLHGALNAVGGLLGLFCTAAPRAVRLVLRR